MTGTDNTQGRGNFGYFLGKFHYKRTHCSDNCEYFVLNIDKFDVEASSNNSNMRDRLTIPNNNSTTNFYDPSVTFDGTGSQQDITTTETTLLTNKNVTDINATDSIFRK